MTKAAVLPDESLVQAAGVHARRFDDEVVILDLSGGDYFALDAVGALIWEQLVGGRTPDEVADAIVARYPVDRERAMADCLALVGELLERGLLERPRPREQ
jgi:hypothetical protein